MKTFKAKVTRGECEVQYIVRAEDKDAAAAKLFQISGERKLKITEVWLKIQMKVRVYTDSHFFIFIRHFLARAPTTQARGVWRYINLSNFFVQNDE